VVGRVAGQGNEGLKLPAKAGGEVGPSRRVHRRRGPGDFCLLRCSLLREFELRRARRLRQRGRDAEHAHVAEHLRRTASSGLPTSVTARSPLNLKSRFTKVSAWCGVACAHATSATQNDTVRTRFIRSPSASIEYRSRARNRFAP